jgi:hypothetical protein
MRISWTPNIADVPLATTVASSPEDACAAVEAWLAALGFPPDPHADARADR